jgi:hypothetical protein
MEAIRFPIPLLASNRMARMGPRKLSIHRDSLGPIQIGVESSWKVK